MADSIPILHVIHRENLKAFHAMPRYTVVPHGFIDGIGTMAGVNDHLYLTNSQIWSKPFRSIAIGFILVSTWLIAGCSSIPSPVRGTSAPVALTKTFQPSSPTPGPKFSTTSTLSFSSPTATIVEPKPPEIALDLVGQVGGGLDAITVQGSHLYVGNGLQLWVVDVTESRAPRIIWQSERLPGLVRGIALSKGFAYVGAGSSLIIFDLSLPAQPKSIGRYDGLPGSVQSLYIQDNIAYVGIEIWKNEEGCGSLWMIDITNPENMHLLATIPLANPLTAVKVVDHLAYITTWANQLQIFDLSNPSQPRKLSTFDAGGAASDLIIVNQTVYVASTGILMIDVSDPTEPHKISTFDNGMVFESIAIYGEAIYATGRYCDVGGCFGGLYIFNIQNSTPSLIGQGRSDHGSSRELVVDDYLVYVATDAGIQVWDISKPSFPALVGELNTLGPTVKCAFEDEYAYVVGDDLSIRRISLADPLNPTIDGSVALTSHCRDCGAGITDLAVAKGYVYVTLWQDGLSIVNFGDPASPREVSHLALDGTVERLALWNNYVFVVGSMGTTTEQGEEVDGLALWIVDVKDPTQPRVINVFKKPLIEEWDAGNLVITIKDHYLFLAFGDSEENQSRGVILIFDIKDPVTLSEVGKVDVPFQPRDMITIDRYMYLAGAGCYYFTCSGGLAVVDIKIPTNPSLINEHDIKGGSFAVVGSNNNLLVISEDCLRPYCSGRLHVMDASDPKNLTELGEIVLPDQAGKIVVKENYLYIADQDAGLLVFKIEQNP